MPRPNSPETRLRFITRMHDPTWRVWIQFGKVDFGQVYFSEREYGTALKASAIRYRDQMVRQHKIPLRRYDGNGFCVKNARHKSGEVEIHLSMDRRVNPSKIGWAVRNMVDGKQRVTARSILKILNSCF